MTLDELTKAINSQHLCVECGEIFLASRERRRVCSDACRETRKLRFWENYTAISQEDQEELGLDKLLGL